MVELAFPVAACILAEDDTGPLDALVAALDAAGLAPIVAVVADDAVVPKPARAVVVESRRRDEGSALRFGLTQLLNAPVLGAIVVDAHGSGTGLEAIRAVLEGARRTGAKLVVTPSATGPVFAHRDAWRDVLTTPGGLPAVVARYGAAVERVG